MLIHLCQASTKISSKLSKCLTVLAAHLLIYSSSVDIADTGTRLALSAGSSICAVLDVDTLQVFDRTVCLAAWFVLYATVTFGE